MSVCKNCSQPIAATAGRGRPRSYCLTCSPNRPSSYIRQVAEAAVVSDLREKGFSLFRFGQRLLAVKGLEVLLVDFSSGITRLPEYVVNDPPKSAS